MILSRVNHRLEVCLLTGTIFLGFPSCAFRRCHYYLHNTRKRHVSSLTTTSGNYINQISWSLCAQEIYYLRTPSGRPFNGTWKGRKRFSSLAFAVCRDPPHLGILYDSYSISLSPLFDLRIPLSGPIYIIVRRMDIPQGTARGCTCILFPLEFSKQKERIQYNLITFGRKV